METISMQYTLKGFMGYLMNSVKTWKSIWNRKDIASANSIQVNEVVSEGGNPAQILNMGVVESTAGGEYPACGYKAVTVIQRAVAESLLALGDAKAAQMEADTAAAS